MRNSLKLFVLCDMGGSTIKSVAIWIDPTKPLFGQLDLELLDSIIAKTPTLAASGPARTIAQFQVAVDAACKNACASKSHLAGVATCVPTPFQNDRILFGTNLGNDAWSNFPIVNKLAQTFKVPAVAMNDGIAQGQAEANFLSKKVPRKQLYVGWGTGFAGDFCQNGISFEDGLVTELGHFVAPPLLHVNGFYRQCGCGQANHVEALGGSPALAYRASEAVKRGLCPALIRMGWETKTTFDQQAGLVLDCAQAGDAVCLELVRYCGQCVGCTFSASVTSFGAPDRYVVGMSAKGEVVRAAFMEGVIDAFRKTTWRPLANDPKLSERFVWAKMGGLAGCLGTLPKLVRAINSK